VGEPGVIEFVVATLISIPAEECCDKARLSAGADQRNYFVWTKLRIYGKGAVGCRDYIAERRVIANSCRNAALVRSPERSPKSLGAEEPRQHAVLFFT